MDFCLFKGDFGKISEIGQPHSYTMTRLIFLVRVQTNLWQVVWWGSHMEPRLEVTTILTKIHVVSLYAWLPYIFLLFSGF